MFFIIHNDKYLSDDQVRTDILMHAYYNIEYFPMRASDTLMDNYIQSQYKTTLKNLCIKLLLNITFYKDMNNNFILMFKNPKYDKLARLITYGNGAIPGSRILRAALDY